MRRHLDAGLDAYPVGHDILAGHHIHADAGDGVESRQRGDIVDLRLIVQHCRIELELFGLRPEAGFGRDFVATLPEDMGALIAGLSAPPAPFVPEQYRLAPGYALVVVGFGSAEEHAQVVQPIRATLPPLFELVTPIPYAQLQQILLG